MIFWMDGIGKIDGFIRTKLGHQALVHCNECWPASLKMQPAEAPLAYDTRRLIAPKA